MYSYLHLFVYVFGIEDMLFTMSHPSRQFISSCKALGMIYFRSPTDSMLVSMF